MIMTDLPSTDGGVPANRPDGDVLAGLEFQRDKKPFSGGREIGKTACFRVDLPLVWQKCWVQAVLKIDTPWLRRLNLYGNFYREETVLEIENEECFQFHAG